jgi:hypothetical protein
MAAKRVSWVVSRGVRGTGVMTLPSRMASTTSATTRVGQRLLLYP